LRLKISRDETLSALRDPGILVDIKLADVSAADDMLDIDDAKFTDWCKHNQLAWLWYCPNFNRSALLQLAIKTCIKKSPNHQHETQLQVLDIEPKFLGFGTSEIDGSVIRQFHIHIFVPFYTQSAKTGPPDYSITKTTVVICELTTCIHICSIMQDCLLQLMQLLQF
jgi:hypothetical protein